MTETPRKRIAIGSALLAILTITAMVGPAVGTITVDTETTDTSGTSDISEGSTVTDLDNTSERIKVRVKSTNASTSSLSDPGDAFTINFTISDANNGDDGHTFFEDDSKTWLGENGSSDDYWVGNFSKSRIFDEMTRDLDENVSVDVTVTFNESESDAESVTFTINAQNGNDTVVDAITDDDVENDDDVEVITVERRVFDDFDVASADVDDVDVDSNTTVKYVFVNETFKDQVEAAYDLETFSSGDFVYPISLSIDGRPVAVFDDQAGDDVDEGIVFGGFDSDEDDYAVYRNGGGTNGTNPELEITLNTVDEDAEDVDVLVEGHRSHGFWTIARNFGLGFAREAGTGTNPA